MTSKQTGEEAQLTTIFLGLFFILGILGGPRKRKLTGQRFLFLSSLFSSLLVLFLFSICHIFHLLACSLVITSNPCFVSSSCFPLFAFFIEPIRTIHTSSAHYVLLLTLFILLIQRRKTDCFVLAFLSHSLYSYLGWFSPFSESFALIPVICPHLFFPS
ncbi:hypothetical protein QBC37DRAFT_129302 [Rhypophila decipiens]|uniref:Uncharacterized protein n=1 Tax=Rhypophila decipiens TaxID=261697 RepID=A0AAN7B761_9PEZI|nr:hypothetical protein QBC37DRAFT_129302 [Rhypophila decipiens]